MSPALTPSRYPCSAPRGTGINPSSQPSGRWLSKMGRLNSLSTNSAYRSASYQWHFWELKIMYDNITPAVRTRCPEQVAKLINHIKMHGIQIKNGRLQVSNPSSTSQNAGQHVRGEAFDASWGCSDALMDQIASQFGLHRPFLPGDPPHFTLR